MLTVDALHTRESREFFEYWQSLPKEGGLVPDRRHFDPLAIRRLMPMMVMVEYDRIETATFRYAGSRLTEILGFDPTKKKYLDLLEQDAMESFLAASGPMITLPCGGVFSITLRTATGYTKKCEALDLPLYNEKAGTWIVLALISIRETVDMHGGNEFRIAEIGEGNWIDIGAGVPAS
ncbi:MAG: PAS domain-containing protein [Parvibaculum sp.]|uniref:PAS domain-containing protein n=1 Tax=Parvibaculum sp. TaxID=2024848 RepID=UPI0032676892